jgi:hypothetical protein
LRPARPPQRYQLIRERQDPIRVQPVQEPAGRDDHAAGSRSSDGDQGLFLVVADRELSVDPGAEITTEVRIANTGSLVEQADIDIRGLPRPWFSVEPAAVRLDVKTETKAALRVRPPRKSTSAAGRIPFEVSIWSTTNPNVRCTQPAFLTIRPYFELSDKLEPLACEARRQAEQTLTLNNRGNSPVPVEISATDPSSKVRCRCEPRRVTVAPGQDATIDIRVTAVKRLIVGAAQIRPYAVVINGPPEGPITVPGSMSQLPLLPRWATKVAAAVVVVLLIIVALLAKKALAATSTGAVPGTVPAATSEARLFGSGFTLSPQRTDKATDG